MRAVLCDIDGVVHQHGQAIAGAAEALNWLAQQQIPLRFITNTTSKTPQAMATELNACGLNVDPAHIINPTRAACRWLTQQGIERVHTLVAPGIAGEFRDFATDDQQPQAVVVGDVGQGFCFDSLNRVFRLLMQDTSLPLLALGMTRYYADGEGLNLDLGPFIKALEYATGREALVMGKPAALVFQMALAELGVSPDQAVMIGDDRLSDVLAAQRAGITGVLVRTGKFRAGDDAADGDGKRPDHVLASVAGLPALLQALKPC
ncbi:TIGR01458 family HAD-type hydrolase [Thalassolituus sp. LLYu03]|uniref:TIGR01458 family HAD-type hydrolase n=1 Tax=Thalassolituus sp. LLYu03 TaxID=3421656 RepID=UPI003D299A3F